MTTKPRCCNECGTVLPPRKTKTGRRADFCSTECRKAFNNRRAMRGAVLYDVVMAGRYDRKNNPDYISTMTMIARYWREEDERMREARPSWNTDVERDALTEVLSRIDATRRELANA